MPFDFDDRPREWMRERDYEGAMVPYDAQLAAVKRADREPALKCAECGELFRWPASSSVTPLCSAKCREDWEAKHGPLSAGKPGKGTL